MNATSVSQSRTFLPWSAAWTVWLGALLLLGCTGGVCENTNDCGSGNVCVARLCQQLSCGQSLLLADPDSGSCVALSGCFLTAAQRGWKSCPSADPCKTLTEDSCLADARCQPAYALDAETVGPSQCGSASRRLPTGASVAGQADSFHVPLVCWQATERRYAGCRSLPALPVPCSALDEEECTTRAECKWGQVQASFSSPTTACTERRPLRSPDCATSGGTLEEREVSCLVNPLCQPTGTACYCPPGATCPCSGGTFVGCEHNDRQRPCTSDTECGAGETCNRSATCPQARDGFLTSTGHSQPCLGTCGKSSCDGLDEASCHGRADCTEVYGTECSEAASQYYSQCPLSPTGSSVAGCLCDNVFQRCVAQDPAPGTSELRSERSLLVRDPEIVRDPAFRLDNVLSRFAPPGKEELFISNWFELYSKTLVLESGAKAPPRQQLTALMGSKFEPLLRDWLAQRWHTTALINRLDLLRPGQCGEARISFAYNGGYGDVSQRMTLIVELVVPDDGQGCQQVAQKWAELSAIEDPAVRLERLKALYDLLLRPEHLGQVRSNEFINPSRSVAWEMREWHLSGSGLVLAPAKQAVDERFSDSTELLAWVQASRDPIRAGTAEIPARFLAAMVPVNGKTIRLPGSSRDAGLMAAQQWLNRESCAGCHLGSTGTPFVHIGERLALKDNLPVGRAVVSSFLREQLGERARTLRAVWQGGKKAQALRFTAQLRVH